jgi:hypothetical protein
MILRPPYFIDGVSLENLGVIDAVLTCQSLDVDQLTFTLRDQGQTIPTDGQWITLTDTAGQVLIKGICRRKYTFRTRSYSYLVTNVFQGMAETTIVVAGRPYALYDMQDLAQTLSGLLSSAAAAGLPITATTPVAMPVMYLAPKMAFRSATYAEAIIEAAKWVPDLASRMNYSIDPPRLDFTARATSSGITLEIGSDDSAVTDFELEAMPEARALAITFSYAKRDGTTLVENLTQSAGDPDAEAHRKTSIFLSGTERIDLLASEALTQAEKAITALAAAVTDAAASAALPLNWATCLAADSNLSAAVSALPGFSMGSGGICATLYNGIVWGSGSTAGIVANTVCGNPLYLAAANGTAATGWYAVKSGVFTDAQLTTAGAKKETRYIRGNLAASRGYSGSNAAMASLEATGYAYTHDGWTANRAADSTDAENYYRKYLWYNVNLAVDAINMSPSAVAVAVNAAAGNTSSALATRMEFVEAPANLAASYFARQDWTPYRGKISLKPTAGEIPRPGDFVNLAGPDVPAEYATMKAAVAGVEIDLRTSAATLTIGPSARLDYASIEDRLRVPEADSTTPG